MQAMVDAKMAIRFDASLLKAHHRLTQAQLGLERFKAAMQTAQGRAAPAGPEGRQDNRLHHSDGPDRHCWCC